MDISPTSEHLVFLQTEHHELGNDLVEAIRCVTGDTVDIVRELIPSLSPTLNVTFFPGAYPGAGIIETTGIGAFAANADWVRIALDPNAPGGLEHAIATHLPAALAHELHHCARIRALGMPDSLVGALIFEGLATVFERDVTGGVPPWGDYADVPIQEWTDEMLALGDDYRHGEWFFTHPDGRRWIGYRVGTYLADRACTASGKRASELVGAPIDEALGLAGYAAAH